MPVRLIAERHIVEDLGRIPSFADWVRCIRPEPWMGGKDARKGLDDIDAAGEVDGAGQHSRTPCHEERGQDDG